MSTVAKGDAFEEETFLLLKKELEAGRLGISPSSGKIFKRKGYYSKDREKNIIVDISIEVWLPGADRYSMLWVCECKDYGRSVPVDDVEELKSKLDQIAGKNIKGVVATRNAFQEGAIKYARNQGLGLVRIMPEDQVSWFVYCIMSGSAPIQDKLNPREFRVALSNEGYQAKERSFYSVYDGYIFGSWIGLIRHSLSGSA